MIDRVGGAGGGAAGLEGDPLLEVIDGVDGGVDGASPLAALFGAADDVETVARGTRVRDAGLDEALLAPAREQARRAVDVGAITAALTRIAKRPVRPDESPAEARMRKIIAKYLALRHEVAAGMGRISVG